MDDHHSDGRIDEERKGLLSGEAHDESDSSARWSREPWPRNKLVGTAIVFILILVGGAFARVLMVSPAAQWSPNSVKGDKLASNGTHEFKKTVVIVSIDGLRADYLDRGLTPHLLGISKQGLRSKFMRPVFPTLTFPNHWALMTGLYAESHGIVGNNFWDPETDSEFHYNNVRSSWNSSWWFGEPMWETAENAGVMTANLMWPGPPATISGVSSTYFIPYKNNVSLDNKMDQILAWIDLPLEKRPQLIMAYEPSLDQAGHKYGPMSKSVNGTLAKVDQFAKDLHTALKMRNLFHIVDIIFVSDHGMADTSHPELIYVDDILGDVGYDSIQHNDGWPSMGLRFYPEVNQTHYLHVLLEASEASENKFSVYTHETMPERYHFSYNERIAPIYVVPKLGYALTDRKEGDVGMSKGNHGYDNHDYQMHAIFVAHGPFSTTTKVSHLRRGQSLLRRFLSREKHGWHSTSDNTYVMKGFQNVEVYNLVMKLLAIEDNAASTNGTIGFWDQYL